MVRDDRKNVWIGNNDGLWLFDNSKTKQHLVTRKIGEMEEILVPHGFIRTSRSFIINPVYLSRIDRKQLVCILEIEGVVYEIPVSEMKIKAIG